MPFPGWSDAAAHLLYQAVSATHFDPQHIRPANLLSAELARHIPEAGQMCLDQLSAHLAKAPGIHALTNPDWSRSQALQRFYATNEPARHRSSGPILLLQGTKDLSVMPAATNRLDYELCELGDRVHYRTYPGADHDARLAQAYSDVREWMRTRLAGRQAPDDCQPAPTTAHRELAATGAFPALPWISASLGALVLGATTMTLLRRRTAADPTGVNGRSAK
ncbi:alpha/beta hydrolase family protein [Streptomyces sp. NPDC020490]|uniref:alpha/beta hydrolase family protein n=1 Tax=Streptomyces sp. NPDC020490 TaxID=3365078 RepID=UPI0037B0FC8D